MTHSGVPTHPRAKTLLLAIAVTTAMAACVSNRIPQTQDGPYAPGVDPRGEAVNGVDVGNRLMAAQEYELAIGAFTRAALEQGLTAEILSGMGTANLQLGRLGQAETLMRRAVEADDEFPAAWNNLGVVLMERGKTAEAEQVFRRAYALDNGESDAIRDNLRLALAKSKNPANVAPDNNEYKLVQRGEGDFLLRRNQD